MFTAVKKQYLLLALAVCLLAALLPAATVLAPRVGMLYAKKTIVIDAGHGGYDGGVTGITSGVKESAVNLELARLVGAYCESDGYKVVHTRTADEARGNTKQEDMKARIRLINSSGADLLLSLHVNFYPSKHRRGIQVFFNKQADEPLADVIQETINYSLNKPTLNRNFGCLYGDYYILANANCPAALVECGFFSNAEDEKQLLDEGYRMKLAYIIFSAIKKANEA